VTGARGSKRGSNRHEDSLADTQRSPVVQGAKCQELLHAGRAAFAVGGWSETELLKKAEVFVRESARPRSPSAQNDSSKTRQARSHTLRCRPFLTRPDHHTAITATRVQHPYVPNPRTSVDVLHALVLPPKQDTLHRFPRTLELHPRLPARPGPVPDIHAHPRGAASFSSVWTLNPHIHNAHFAPAKTH
jgi:hypothetical protein